MIDAGEIKKKIVEALMPIDPEKIILFGSYAYGSPTEDSDLDSCVIERDFDNKWKEIDKIRKLLSEINLPKDILLERLDFYEAHISEEWINTAWYEANKYGQTLYEKG